MTSLIAIGSHCSLNAAIVIFWTFQEISYEHARVHQIVVELQIAVDFPNVDQSVHPRELFIGMISWWCNHATYIAAPPQRVLSGSATWRCDKKTWWAFRSATSPPADTPRSNTSSTAWKEPSSRNSPVSPRSRRRASPPVCIARRRT